MRICRGGAIAFLGLLAGGLQAEPICQVTVEDRVLGPTPQIIGINTGEMPEGCAFPEWIRALGVNGARLRLNIEPARMPDENVSSRGDLEDRARKLRAGAAKETAMLWTHPAKVAAPSLVALREAGLELLATITCPFSYKLLQPDGKTNWSQAWRFWSAYYAQAYQLARQHQVRRFQLFNEPNHKESLKLTQEEYAVRMAIGCDAIQAALADAGRDDGIQRQPLISAPCTAGIGYFEKSGKPEARDDKIGWGQLSMRDRHVRMGGRADSGYAQFQQYAVQAYSSKPASWLEQLGKLDGQIRQANGGVPLPVIMSEYNIHTARDFAQRPTTMESPEEFSQLGSMMVAIAESGLRELYFFRLTLSQNLDGTEVKKNGIHHVNESGSVPEITGTTRSAEVIRLGTALLRGGRDRLATQGAPDVRVAATRDQGDTRVWLARTNTATETTVQIQLPAPATPVLLTWETVTDASFGNLRILPSPADPGKVSVDVPGFSVGLLSVRPVANTAPTILASSASHGTESGRLSTGGMNRAQTIFQFPAPAGKEPGAVFLRLKGKSPSNQPVPIHLYRLSQTLGEATPPSDPFPFRKKNATAENEPALEVAGLGRDLQWVGGFTVAPGEQETCVEITPAVMRAKGEPLAFVLTRDRRQAGEILETGAVEWQGAELLVYAR